MFVENRILVELFTKYSNTVFKLRMDKNRNIMEMISRRGSVQQNS